MVSAAAALVSALDSTLVYSAYVSASVAAVVAGAAVVGASLAPPEHPARDATIPIAIK